MSEIRPLYFDHGTNQITEAKPGDTLALPVTSVVIEYVTLLQNTDVNTCCALIDQTAIPVNSVALPILAFRKTPYVDCIILESGLAGQRVQAALTHGSNYITSVALNINTTDILYLGQDSKLTLTIPSVNNGDHWLVVVGRLANQNEFIFDPQTPVDLTNTPGGSGSLPSILSNPNTWLFTDGTNILWKKIKASDIAPAFAIKSFTLSYQNVELGQNISNVQLSASYNSLPSSVRYKDSISNSWIAIASPYIAATSPGSFINYSISSVSFTLEATDTDLNIQTASININWLPRKFWGNGPPGFTINQLQNSILSNSLNQSFTITAAINEYIFLAIPSSFGTPTFYVGGFEGGFSKISSINYTNSYGVTLPYDIWQSDNTGLGTTTVSVS